MWCMPGDESQTSYTLGFQPGTICRYWVYDNPAQVNVPTLYSDRALCGFNVWQNAYCNQRKGDTLFLGYLAKAKVFYAQDIPCH